VPPATDLSLLDRARAWLVTGALGRGLAFAIDFAAAARTMLRARRAR
jgi:transketolase N-terminal domain/subunit